MPAEPQEISSTTQKFLDIFDITSNVVVLRDGTVSMILMISAMNFGLLAEQEQDSIIYAYAALLNSLNFPIQIVVSSKTKDATAYLQLLEDQIQKTSSDEKKNLIRRYQGFVGRLIKERNVLDKKFYVVIPAAPIEVGMFTAQSVLPGNQKPEITEEQKASVIEKALGVLEPRRDHLIAQFNRIGLYARQINTQEIIEVFYNNYNPEAYEGQHLTDSQNYATAVVTASQAQAPSVSELQEQLEQKSKLEEIAGAGEERDVLRAERLAAASNPEPQQQAPEAEVEINPSPSAPQEQAVTSQEIPVEQPAVQVPQPQPTQEAQPKPEQPVETRSEQPNKPAESGGNPLPPIAEL